MNENEKLRQDRLVFYKKDMQKIDAVLSNLLRLSNGKCALLVDKEGHMVARSGHSATFDVDTISALVAGSFAATHEMARILGEEEFTVMFHQGKRDNIQLNLIGDRTILTVIFDEATTVGMVRLYTAEAGKKLEEIFDEMDGSDRTDEEVNLEADYDATAKARLDTMFK